MFETPLLHCMRIFKTLKDLYENIMLKNGLVLLPLKSEDFLIICFFSPTPPSLPYSPVLMEGKGEKHKVLTVLNSYT